MPVSFNRTTPSFQPNSSSSVTGVNPLSTLSTASSPFENLNTSNFPEITNTISRLRSERGSARAAFERTLAGPSTAAATTSIAGEGGARAEAAINRMSLFRGMTNSPEMKAALHAMESGEPTVLPLMWGFRQYEPGKSLGKKEINTLQSFLKDVNGLKSVNPNVKPVLMLADLHAQHNNVPAEAVPAELGGQGKEGYRAYYAKVAEEAEKLGIETVFLSKVFGDLKITPEQVAKAGKELTRLPNDTMKDPVPGMVMVSNKDLKDYAVQAEHMVQRYPTVPKNKAILKMSAADRKAAILEKELGYIHFRAGEGELLLPNLSKAFDNANVIPVHVSDPSAGKIGVNGLYIKSKDYKNVPSNDIPWKEDPKTERPKKEIVNLSQQPPEVVTMIKAVKDVMGVHYAFGEEGLMVQVAKELVPLVQQRVAELRNERAEVRNAKESDRKQEQERVEIRRGVKEEHPDWSKKELREETAFRQSVKRDGWNNIETNLFE